MSTPALLNNARIAVFYEHPEWFKPVFAELDRRGLEYDGLLAQDHQFDPMETHSPYAIIVNRMSPSPYTRGPTSKPSSTWPT